MADTKHEIYCFNNGGSHGWYRAVAIGDDGHVLATHICSHESFMRHDLGMTSNWKHDEYNAHFGENNWTLVWIDDVCHDPRLTAAMVKNQALEKEYEDGTQI